MDRRCSSDGCLGGSKGAFVTRPRGCVLARPSRLGYVDPRRTSETARACACCLAEQSRKQLRTVWLPRSHVQPVVSCRLNSASPPRGSSYSPRPSSSDILPEVCVGGRGHARHARAFMSVSRDLKAFKLSPSKLSRTIIRLLFGRETRV